MTKRLSRPMTEEKARQKILALKQKYQTNRECVLYWEMKKKTGLDDADRFILTAGHTGDIDNLISALKEEQEFIEWRIYEDLARFCNPLKVQIGGKE